MVIDAREHIIAEALLLFANSNCRYEWSRVLVNGSRTVLQPKIRDDCRARFVSLVDELLVRVQKAGTFSVWEWDIPVSS